MDPQQLQTAIDTGSAIARMSWEQWVSLALFVFVAPHIKAIYGRAAEAATYLLTGQQGPRKRARHEADANQHERDQWRQEITSKVNEAASDARRAATASEKTAAELQRVNIRLERGDGELKALRRDIDRVETICRAQHGG